MSDIHLSEKLKQKTLYSIGYDYLCNNFHKFSEPNKIKVSLEVIRIFNRDDTKTVQTQFLIIEKSPTVKNRLEELAENAIQTNG